MKRFALWLYKRMYRNEIQAVKSIGTLMSYHKIDFAIDSEFMFGQVQGALGALDTLGLQGSAPTKRNKWDRCPTCKVPTGMGHAPGCPAQGIEYS